MEADCQAQSQELGSEKLAGINKKHNYNPGKISYLIV